jgi:hypothetical protein
MGPRLSDGDPDDGGGGDRAVLLLQMEEVVVSPNIQVNNLSPFWVSSFLECRCLCSLLFQRSQ